MMGSCLRTRILGSSSALPAMSLHRRTDAPKALEAAFEGAVARAEAATKGLLAESLRAIGSCAKGEFDVEKPQWLWSVV